MTGLIPPVSPLAYEGSISIPYIIRNFPPEPTFNTFPVPTVWIDPEHEEAYIQVAKPLGSAVWVTISSVPGVLFTITTPTGTVVPSAGNINFINGAGININGSGNNITFSIQIPLGATLGGTGQTTYNVGDILYASAPNILNRLPIGSPGEVIGVKTDGTLGYLDDVGDGNVIGEDSSNIGDVAVFTDTSGKKIGSSNINSVDGLTRITKSTSGEQIFKVENIFSNLGNNSGIKINVTDTNSRPYLDFNNGVQNWRLFLENEDSFRLTPFASFTTLPYISFFPNGMRVSPYQPIARATLGNTPEISPITNFPIGSNLSFNVIEDRDGINPATNFFPGSPGQGASYTTQYGSVYYLVVYKFLINKQPAIGDETFTFQVVYGSDIYNNRGFIPSNFNFITITGSELIRATQGQKISFRISTSSGGVNIGSFASFEIDNIVSIYMIE